MVKHLYFSHTTNSLFEDDGGGGGSNDNDGRKRVLLATAAFIQSFSHLYSAHPCIRTIDTITL